MAFTAPIGLVARAANAEREVVKLHKAPPWGMAGSLSSRKHLAFTWEGGTAPRWVTLGSQAGNLSRCTLSMGRSSRVGCQHPFGIHLWAAGWEGLTAYRNHPRALISGHPTPQDWYFHLFSSVTSWPRVRAKLLLWMSLPLNGWELHQATAAALGPHRTQP